MYQVENYVIPTSVRYKTYLREDVFTAAGALVIVHQAIEGAEVHAPDDIAVARTLVVCALPMAPRACTTQKHNSGYITFVIY